MHRDIKPANVFITGSGTLKLGDMGLGRQLSQESVAAFSKVGTPLYMSPELLKGDGYDMKSDIWSLGCVLVSSIISAAHTTCCWLATHLCVRVPAVRNGPPALAVQNGRPEPLRAVPENYFL
jgi:serine/threonine protein kinase